MSEKVFDGGLQPGHNVAIGIDPSLTGFAMSAVSIMGLTEHETWVYKSSERGIDRLLDISDWMINKFLFLEENSNGINDIAIETSVMASPSSLPLSELSGVIRLRIFQHFFDNEKLQYPLRIPPMTLKKFAAGKGNAKKQEMLLQIYKRWGVEFNDDNAADAYALGRLAVGYAMNDTELEIQGKIKDPKYRE